MLSEGAAVRVLSQVALIITPAPDLSRSPAHPRDASARGPTIADILGQRSTAMATHYSENARSPG